MIGATANAQPGQNEHVTSRVPALKPATVIQPSHGWSALNLRELWHFRELVYFLAWRDVKVRYKQTGLGVAWALLQPALAMAIFSVFFGMLLQVPSEGVPYPLFAYAGLLPWTYFANATSNASGSLVANTHLISKVYFPRLAIPISAVLSGLVDLAIGLVLLIVLLAVFGFPPTPTLLLIPLLVAGTMATALAVGTWLSALDVQYRDVRYAIPFLVQVWLFATPVVYPVTVVPEQWRAVYGLNPMAGMVSLSRWILLGQTAPAPDLMVVSAIVVVVVLVTGLLFFRRMERTFADVV